MSDRTPKGPLYVVSIRTSTGKWFECWVGSSRVRADREIAKLKRGGDITKLQIL